MTETNVFQLSQPGTFADPLTEVLAAPSAPADDSGLDRSASSHVAPFATGPLARKGQGISSTVILAK